MLVVENVRQVNKGALVASMSVRIPEWRLVIYEVKIFQKGTNRWLGMPCKEVVSQTGEKKYFELVQFDKDELAKNQFRDQVLAAFDRFMSNAATVTAGPGVLIPTPILVPQGYVPF